MDIKAEISNGVHKKISTPFAIAVIAIVATFVGAMTLIGCRYAIYETGTFPPAHKKVLKNNNIIGGDHDEHGCITSAGYQWCEEKQKCLRSWEESCGSLDDQTATDENANTNNPMGYIKKVYSKGGKRYLDIDYIQWFSGNDAQKAMIEDNECFRLEDGECSAPDGFYIRNKNKLIRTLEVAGNADIQESAVFKGEGDGNDYITINFDDLANGFASNDNYLKDLPVRIEIKNNIVTKITQQYLP